MKRIIIFFIVVFYCDTIFSQEVQFEIFAGPHLSSTTYSISSATQPTDTKVGFHLGAGYKIPFDGILFFSPSISYAMRGYEVQFNQPSYPPDLLAIDNNTTFHEIDVDPLLQFDLSKKANHLFIKAGPSFNFILSGKEKYNLATGEYIGRSMKFSTTNSYGRYNASLVGQFGFETSKGFIIYAYYLRGLISMNNETQGPSIYNSMYGLTLGVSFKSKIKL
jgi:hypothetical protein